MFESCKIIFKSLIYTTSVEVYIKLCVVCGTCLIIQYNNHMFLDLKKECFKHVSEEPEELTIVLK